MAETKASRAERRRAAARARVNGQPEMTHQGTRHLTGTCAGCVFWDTADESVTARPGMGVCREGPVQLVSVPSPNGPILQALWGLTAATVVCGRHLTPAEYEAKRKHERKQWGI